MYVRTDKNLYGLDIIIDVSDNDHFVQTSGLDWINIDNSYSPKIGDYWYQDNVISPGDDNYNLIEKIIFDVEEEKRLVREAEEKQFEEDQAKLLAQALDDAEKSDLMLDSPPPIIPEEPPTIDLVEFVKSLPRPTLIPLSEVLKDEQKTPELLEEWTRKNNELVKLIGAVVNSTRFEDQKVYFDPLLVENQGTPEEYTREFMLIPDSTKEEYLEHLRAVDADQKEFLTSLKTELGL